MKHKNTATGSRLAYIILPLLAFFLLTPLLLFQIWQLVNLSPFQKNVYAWMDNIPHKEPLETYLLANGYSSLFSVVQDYYSPTSGVLGASTSKTPHLYTFEELLQLSSGWEKLKAQYPNTRDIYLKLFEIYSLMGNTEVAKENLLDAFRVDPNNEIVRVKMAGVE